MKPFLIQLLLAVVYSQELLSNVYITFSLGGNINYTPPSGGGLPVPGYQMTVGFDRFSWLGVMFMTPTYTNSYDVLIVKRASTQSGGLYSCTIKDYYVTSGRPTNLMSDTNTNMDLMTPSSANSSAFKITIPRTKANTSGEDWEGGEFVQVCFFTSDAEFSQSSWSKQYQVCYGYSVNNFVSTYRGNYLTTMGFEGVNAKVYGGLYGPILQMQLFWYRPNPTIANTSAMIIQIGDKVSDLVGYDYYQCGVGDFFGDSPTTLQKDLDYSGFENGACSVSSTANSISMSYSRQIYTYDDFDSTLTQGTTICLIGALSHCSSISLPLNYPIMSVTSALTISQVHFYLHWLALCLLFLIMT